MSKKILLALFIFILPLIAACSTPADENIVVLAEEEIELVDIDEIEELEEIEAIHFDEGEDEDDHDSDDDNESDDDDEDEEETPEEEALDKIEDAVEEIAEAEETIIEKEAEGKDVSEAYLRLEDARTTLTLAEEALAAGDFEVAEDLAREAKHLAMYAKGKDIHSKNEEARFGQDFGECIADAVKEDDHEEEFEDCFEDFSEKVEDFVEDKLPEDDKVENAEITAALEALAATLEERISAILLELTDFNFSGVESDDILEDIEDILEDEQLDEEGQALVLDMRIDELKDESSEHKFNEGIIPFKDTDDEKWFFSFVNQMEEEGCVSGFTDHAGNPLGEFRPSNGVNFGESTKFVTQCLLGLDSVAIADGEFWANAYGRVLQEDFSELLSTDILARLEAALLDSSEFKEGFTRGELIQLTVDVLGLEVPVATEAPFSDVSLDHPNVDAIALALQLGVITGDQNEGTFRAEDVPNRAEVAKIITLAKQLF